MTNTEDGSLEVVLQLINCSKEHLEIPKNSLLGIAEELEELESKVPTSSSKSKKVNTVSKSKLSDKRAHLELKEEIQSKMEDLSNNVRKILQPVLIRYKNLFREPVDNSGCKVNIKHKIDTGDNPPIQKNPYRLPFALKLVVEEQIKYMYQKGIIQESDSPWGSPVDIVRKKSLDGTPKYRFCVDYRTLNAITCRDAYALPNIT